MPPYICLKFLPVDKWICPRSLKGIAQSFQKQFFVKRFTAITSLQYRHFQKQLIQIDPVFSSITYLFSSICGWSLVTFCMLMSFATASSSYKSLVSKVDYHKMLSPDNCHKLCKYCVIICLDLVFPTLNIAEFY